MKRLLKSLPVIIAIVVGGLFSNNANAQCDTIASLCGKHLQSGYISDGQQYRALLINDEVSEFHTTFYGGSTYRIAACSGLTDGNLIFSVYDNERNLLFTNKDHSNSAYWDLKITSTINCIIEAHLDTEKVASGCCVLLVGFKQ